MERLKDTVAATISGFEDSLRRFMPATPYRDFQLWAARSTYRDTWSQVLGIPQFSKLTYGLLHDLVSDADWPYLLNYSNIMNSYLILEAVSDNFASQLQPNKPDDPSQRQRIQVLHTLNYTTITRLESTATPTTELLASARLTAEKLSCFANSIAHHEQFTLAQNFLSERPDLVMDDLEFGGWAVLVANVDACVEVSDVLRDMRLGDLLRKGLAWRYQAVTRLLHEHDLPLEEWVDISTKAVLVIPYLAYYISILTEVLQPTPRLGAILEDDRLERALYKAALLVRLSNDVGTELVMRPEYRNMLLDRLDRHANPRHSINDALLKLAEELPFLTRMQKDIAFGEFNTSLYDVGDLPCSSEALAHFEQHLTKLGYIYAHNRALLFDELHEITGLLGSDSVSKLIWRFVEFHERLYSYPFDSQAGDYATRPNVQTVPDRF